MTQENSRELIIEAGRVNFQYWKDLWQYRDLLWILCRRDLSVRYKQTFLGVAWALFRPLLSIITFTILLGQVAKLPSEPEIPYAVLIFSGSLAWNFFVQCLNGVSASLLSNGNLIGKVYMPRLIIPASTVAVALVDFAVSFTLFCGFLAWFKIVPPVQCLAMPLFVLLGGLLAFGPGLILSSLTLYYRDVGQITSIIISLGMYLTPVIYTSSLVPEQWRTLYELNPMVGVVDGFRWAMLGTPELPVQALCFSLGWAVVLLWIGVAVFRRMERTFVDVM